MIGANHGSRNVRELSLRSGTCGSDMMGPETAFRHDGLGSVGEGKGGGTLKKLFCALIAGIIGAVPYLASLTISPRTSLPLETHWAGESTDAQPFRLIIASAPGGVPTTRARRHE